MKLYGFGPTRSLRALWGLKELGIDFEFEAVSLPAREHQRPEFLRLNPAGKVPVLVDGDLVLNESVAIALYLAEKYPDKQLIPSDVRGRAEVYRWSLFAATELEQPLWRIARNTFLYAEEERLAADIALARRDFAAMAPVLEAHLEGREFVVGERVSVADFVTAYTLDWANEEALLEGLPHLLAYMNRMYARPKAPLRIAEAFARLRA
jgi:glutathione S-transferase